MLEFKKFYHIYNHGNGDDNIFRQPKNYPFFLEKYGKHINPIADTIAWCLMPNHFHLLIRIRSKEEIVKNILSAADAISTTSLSLPKFQTLEEMKAEKRKLEEIGKRIDEKFLSRQFANFFSSYTQSFNKLYKRRGSLFIKNFKRKEVDSRSYLKSLIFYIHLNPVKHGFVSDMDEWQWTSIDEFPDKHKSIFSLLFDDLNSYRNSHLEKEKNFAEYLQLESDLS